MSVLLSFTRIESNTQRNTPNTHATNTRCLLAPPALEEIIHAQNTPIRRNIRFSSNVRSRRDGDKTAASLKSFDTNAYTTCCLLVLFMYHETTLADRQSEHITVSHLYTRNRESNYFGHTFMSKRFLHSFARDTFRNFARREVELGLNETHLYGYYIIVDAHTLCIDSTIMCNGSNSRSVDDASSQVSTQPRRSDVVFS